MKLVRLGRTNLSVPQLGFGALPIQRVTMNEATRIIRNAYEAGVTFFDTARAYSDSEAKLGAAIQDVRHNVVIATKTIQTGAEAARQELETSLRNLRTDYIDIIQLHNPEQVSDPNDSQSAYSALAKAKRAGKVRFIGITNHRRAVARRAVDSGLFDTLQFPLSHISTSADLQLVEHCKAADVGFIAMKALCGGLLTNVTAAFAFFRRLDTVVPIWGIQHQRELDEFLTLEQQGPEFNEGIQSAIQRDRVELAGSFCRGCAYCLPCESDIPIHWAARMSLLLRRAPHQQFLTAEWQEKMNRIEDCSNCGHCTSHCPYELDTPSLLKANLADYREFLESHPA